VPKAPDKIDLEVSGLLLDILPPLIRAIRAAMRALRRPGLTVPQFRVLGFVSLQPCTSKQIAEWHGVSLPAMSRMVNFLVRRGLLIRAADLSDRRQLQLRLSAKGKAEFKRLRRAIETALAARVTLLGKSEKRALGVGLIALKEMFGET
jgi:DNA-binding MarR family transcriptional regulator